MNKRWSVLIIEDDVWLAEQFARSLVSVGIETATVPDVFSALESIDVLRPDVLVLDVLLSGPNAFTLLHEIRSYVDLARLPVILCTNTADSLTSEDVRAYGVTSILNKATMKPTDLVAAVRKVLL